MEYYWLDSPLSLLIYFSNQNKNMIVQMQRGHLSSEQFAFSLGWISKHRLQISHLRRKKNMKPALT